MKHFNLYKSLDAVADISSKLGILSKEIRSVFNPDGCFISLIDSYNKNLVIKHAFLPEEVKQSLKVVSNAYISLDFKHPASDCVKTLSPVVIEDIQESNYNLDVKTILENFTVKSGAHIPICNQDEAIGCVFIFFKTKKDYVCVIPKIQEILSECFYQIKHAMLYSELVNKEKHASGVLQRFDQILGLAIKICSLRESEGFYEAILKNFLASFGFDFGAVFLINDRENLIFETACVINAKFEEKKREYSSYFESVGGYKKSVQDGVTSIACTLNNHFYFEDIKNTNKLPASEKDKAAVKILGGKSLLILPVLRQNMPFGVIQLWSISKHVNLSIDDITAIKKLNSIIEVALENSKLFSVITNQNKELEKNHSSIAVAKKEIDRLNDIAVKLNSNLDFDEIFEGIVSYLLSEYGFEGCSLVLLKGNKYRFIKYIVPEELNSLMEGFKNISFPLDANFGWMSQCMVSNSTLYIKDTLTERIDGDINKNTVLTLKLRSFLIIPIEVKGKVIGSFQISSHKKPVFLVAEQITEIKRFANQMAVALNNALLFEEIKRQKLQLESLNEISKKVSMEIDYEDVFKKIAEYITSSFGFDGFFLSVLGEDKSTYIIEKCYVPKGLEKESEELKGMSFPLKKGAGGTLADCMLNKKTYYFTDIIPESVTERINRDAIERFKIKTVLNEPVIIENEAIGAFTMISSSKSIYLNNEDFDQIKKFVNQIAVTLRNAKLYNLLRATKTELEDKNRHINEDLQMAKQIQTSLLPELDYFKKLFNIEVFFKPVFQIGGDIFDVCETGYKKFRVLLADATGHGVQASLITMLIKSEYNKLKSLNISTHEILNLLNKAFTSSYLNLNVCFTCFLLDIDLNTFTSVYSSAGHIKQLILSGENSEFISTGGRLIGIDQSSKYTSKRKPLTKKDIILLYSDGLIEEFTNPEAYLNEELLSLIVKKNRAGDLKEYSAKIINDIFLHKKNKDFDDDVTMIMIEI
jgi:serine phosphatase RsbU (regulator of sigma subunit)